MVDVNGRRRTYQVRLSTLVVLSIATAALIFVNATPWPETWPSTWADQLQCEQLYGWPLTFARTTNSQPPVTHWIAAVAGLDILIGAMILFVVAYLCNLAISRWTRPYLAIHPLSFIALIGVCSLLLLANLTSSSFENLGDGYALITYGFPISAYGVEMKCIGGIWNEVNNGKYSWDNMTLDVVAFLFILITSTTVVEYLVRSRERRND